ncbi:MAG TPA: hypothetical protein VGK54_08215, partial [Chloroflexota bacterium]
MKGVIALEQQLADRMWAELPQLFDGDCAVQKLQHDIDCHVAAVERWCVRDGVIPAELPPPSRRVYCWLKFLGAPEHLRLHLQALQRADQALSSLNQDREPVQLRLLNTQALWTCRRTGSQPPRPGPVKAVLLAINEGFLNAPPDVWGALLSAATSRRRARGSRMVGDFAHSEEFARTLLDLEALAGPCLSSRSGRVHSLDESFERVNDAYFDGAMPRPRIEWNRRLTVRTFGTYRPHRDAVMLSISLDHERVPSRVVDFVMYHELLHKKHGIKLVKGRRMAHTSAFRSDERRFLGYEEAKRHLDSLARRDGFVLREETRSRRAASQEPLGAASSR